MILDFFSLELSCLLFEGLISSLEIDAAVVVDVGVAVVSIL
jgi:hypothetical protein